jgi:Cu/Ag efflux protein CusF
MSMKVVSPLVLAAVTAMASSALAASMTKTGDIRSTDAAKHELTLSSGETFTVDSHVKLGSFKTGDKVAVTYDTKDGKMLASKVKHAK